MIEVRVFATLREGRDKITMMDAAGITCAGDIIAKLDIPPEEVSTPAHQWLSPGTRISSERRRCRRRFFRQLEVADMDDSLQPQYPCPQ